MAITWQYTTPITVFGSQSHTTRQIRQVLKDIDKVYGNRPAFLKLLDRVTYGARLSNANKVEWMYQKEFPQVYTLSGAHASGATTFTFTSTLGLTADTILVDPVDGEQIHVDSVTNSTTAVVFRACEGTTAIAYATGKKLRLLSVARREGGTRLDAIGVTAAFDENYGQQFEQVFGRTDRQDDIAYYNGDIADEQEQNNRHEYMSRMNRAFHFQKGAQVSAGAAGSVGGLHGNYVMKGMKHFIESAGGIVSVGGAWTYAALNRELTERAKFTRTGQLESIGFCDSQVARIMSEWGLQANQHNVQEIKELGTRVMNFFGTNWHLALMVDEQFGVMNDAGADDVIHTQLNCYNLSEISHLVGVKNPDTLNREITGPARDGDHTIRNQLTGIHTLCVRRPLSHCIFTGITV